VSRAIVLAPARVKSPWWRRWLAWFAAEPRRFCVHCGEVMVDSPNRDGGRTVVRLVVCCGWDARSGCSHMQLVLW
jgi:hypothetical protein